MTEQTRNDFEAWAIERGGISTGRDNTPPANGGTGEYDNAWTNHAWAGWQAATTAERERCARVCDSVNNYDNPMTANDCAAAIRQGVEV